MTSKYLHTHEVLHNQHTGLSKFFNVSRKLTRDEIPTWEVSHNQWKDFQFLLHHPCMRLAGVSTALGKHMQPSHFPPKTCRRCIYNLIERLGQIASPPTFHLYSVITMLCGSAFLLLIPRTHFLTRPYSECADQIRTLCLLFTWHNFGFPKHMSCSCGAMLLRLHSS